MSPTPFLRPGFALPVLFATLVFAPLASAQFAEQAGVIPGPAVWTEGTVTFDADGDGDLDVVFTNGDGFSSAGTARAPTILINTGVTAGNPVFADESATRFPSFTQNGKGVIAFDMDGDDDKDLLFANGFNKQPKLLENDGTGNFSDATAAQFPTGTLNSFGASAGDLDGDGDLDVAMCHHGGTDLTGTGNRVQIFENDGTGTFTNTTALVMPAANKLSQQNVTMLDIDNDNDLDMVCDGRSTPQQVFRNNGPGNPFTLHTNLIPAGSTSVYETDWADLDGDGDLDGFYISLSGFSEGTARNMLIENGTISFTGSTATIIGTNGHDDNEVVFIDSDNDGDLDPIVGSLQNTREKLYRNNGNFTFTFTTDFSLRTDPTLDMTCGDYDGDGDYDVVTAQGEGTPRDNRYYRNSGPADTTAPALGALLSPQGDVEEFPFAVRVKATDSTMDDGDQFVDCVVDYTITPLSGPPVTGSVEMDYVGGTIYRGAIDPALPGTGLLGANVDWSVTATDGAGNVNTSGPTSFVACGVELYGVGLPNANILSLDLTGTPALGQAISLDLTGGQPNAPGVLLIGPRTQVQAFGGTLLVTPLAAVGLNVDGSGSLSIPTVVPNDPNAVGQTAAFQFILADNSFPQGAALSNGLELGICDA